MSYTCAACGGDNPVIVLVTDLRNGDTDMSCEPDMPLMLVGQLALWLGIEPQGLYDAVRRHADKETKKAAAAAQAQAQGQGGSSGEPSPVHPTDWGGDGCSCETLELHQLVLDAAGQAAES